MRVAFAIAAFASMLAAAAPAAAAADDPDQPYEARGAGPQSIAVVGRTDPSNRLHRDQRRGALLVSLYASAAAMNAFDTYSTVTAVETGVGTESNPLMRGVAGHAAAMWAVKGGVTASSLFVAERMWRKHRRVGAITTMIAINVMTAAVAVNNARVLASR